MTAPTRDTRVIVDGDRLFAIRINAGLSLSALADRANVSYPAVHRMEQGGRKGGCRPHTLASVAEALGVTPAALLPDSNCPTCGQAANP